MGDLLAELKKESRPYIPWDKMNAFLIDAFKGYGVPKEDAAICADVLLESDRRGIESHGCNRFKPIYIDRIVKGTLLTVTAVLAERVPSFSMISISLPWPSRVLVTVSLLELSARLP